MELAVINELTYKDQIIIEAKSVEALHDVHKNQLLAYLRLSNKSLGSLVNINVASLKDKESKIRLIN